MKSGRRIGLLFVMIAAVLMFQPVGAWAYSQPDGLCPDAERIIGECDITASGWVMEIVPGELNTPDEGQFPVVTPDGYRYKYMLTGPGTGKSSATQANVLVHSPKVCGEDNKVELLWGDSSVDIDWYDSTTNFSIYDLAHQVISWKSLKVDPANHAYITAYTSESSPSINSFAIKVGNSVEYGVVLCPDCFKGLVAITTTREIQVDPKNPNAFIKVVFRSDGTLLRAVGITDGVETPLTGRDIREFTLNGLSISYVPNEAVIKSGDHSCYWFPYGGLLYGPYALAPDTYWSCLGY